MKNIIEILSGLGMEIPEDKQSELNRQVAENYKTIAEFDKAKGRLETERDNYKSQLETAQTALKEFEGVDVKELNGKIAQLTSDLQTQQNAYDLRIAEMEFMGAIDSAVAGSGARNVKAVKALLDLDTLRKSKNRSEDIKAEIEKVKTENAYMFEDAPKITTGVPSGNGGKKMSISEAMAYANLHPEADISTLI
ncbi:MAG: phage scaffolding protein [Ruminiclostridium sp.]